MPLHGPRRRLDEAAWPEPSPALGAADEVWLVSEGSWPSSMHGELGALVEDVVRSGCSVPDGMRRIVGYCARSQPDRCWELLAALPFEDDLGRLRCWLEGLLASQPPPDHIDGLRLELSHVVRGGGLSMDVHLCGTRSDPHDVRWPLGPSSWDPDDGSHACSEVTDRIHRLSGRLPHAEYLLCLAYVGLAARVLASTVDERLLCREREWRALAVGYDDGGGIVVGTLAKAGARSWTPTVELVDRGPTTRPVRPPLADLAHADPAKRLRAALALGQARPTDVDAVPELDVALDDADPKVRFWAAVALQGIGPAAAAAMPSLVKLVRDGELPVRRVAVEAIVAVGPPATGTALTALIDRLRTDPEPAMRADVAVALGELAADHPEALVYLPEALGDAHPKVRRQAASALRRCVANLGEQPPG